MYNLLNMLGSKNNDERMIGLSQELRDMIQSRRFSNLFKDNVPYAGFEKVNLLKTVDLSIFEQASLMKQGLGDLLHHPTAQVLSSSINKDRFDMKLEANDTLKASQIQIKFISYKTPQGITQGFPKKFQIRFKFFTFDEVRTKYLALLMSGDAVMGG